MKTRYYICIAILLCGLSACNGQVKKKETKNVSKTSDTTKQMNLLDEQTKILGQAFELGGMGSDNPFAGVTNYLELIEKSDLSETQKKELRDFYQAYDMSLDPSKKDSLKIVFSKMLEDAMEKSQNDTNDQR